MYNSASVANRTCFTSPLESPAILFENWSQGDTAEWRNAGTKHDNLVPRVLSLPSFLEVGRERTLGTTLQTWSKMADQTKTGREEYDGVCAKVRITKVLFECEKYCSFFFGFVKLKITVLWWTCLGSCSSGILPGDVSWFDVSCHMNVCEENFLVVDRFVFYFLKSSGLLLLVSNCNASFLCLVLDIPRPLNLIFRTRYFSMLPVGSLPDP